MTEYFVSCFKMFLVRKVIYFMLVKMQRKRTVSIARSRKCYVHLKTSKKMMLETDLMLVKDLIDEKLNYHFSGENCVTDKIKKIYG